MALTFTAVGLDATVVGELGLAVDRRPRGLAGAGAAIGPEGTG